MIKIKSDKKPTVELELRKTGDCIQLRASKARLNSIEHLVLIEISANSGAILYDATDKEDDLQLSLIHI